MVVRPKPGRLVVRQSLSLWTDSVSSQDAILPVRPAAGRGLCPALPVPPPWSSCPLGSALPAVPGVTMPTETESAMVSIALVTDLS